MVQPQLRRAGCGEQLDVRFGVELLPGAIGRRVVWRDREAPPNPRRSFPLCFVLPLRRGFRQAATPPRGLPCTEYGRGGGGAAGGGSAMPAGSQGPASANT